MSEQFAALRSLLSEPGTSERWWEAVELVLKAVGEGALLQTYLLEKTSQNHDWWGCRVPCGDWEPEHSGHGLCKLQTRALESLPNATEVYCPPGTFWMGAPQEAEGIVDAEKPGRPVTLTVGFWALTTPVTQEMFAAVTGESPSMFEAPRRPVEFVSWFDAVHFCNQLSEKAGLTPAYRLVGEEEVHWVQDADGFRLPTEAEWEYLCRAGSTGERYGDLERIAWYVDNSDDETHVVGEKEPNAWGLYDTLGNVWEWCVDEWGEEAYSRLPSVNPAYVPAEAQQRVLRGGCWFYEAENHHAFSRNTFFANEGNDFFGFRIVRTQRGVLLS